MRFLPRSKHAEYAHDAKPDAQRSRDRQGCDGSRSFARAVRRRKGERGILANWTRHVRCMVFGARSSDDDRAGTRYGMAFHECPQAIHVNSKDRLEITPLRLNSRAGQMEYSIECPALEPFPNSLRCPAW